MSQILYQLDNDSLAFPSDEFALSDPNGLLAVGGDLSSKRLLNAYSQGIFPWFNEGDPIMWWSPTPRAIIKTSDIKINKTLSKAIRRAPYTITINKCFEQVNQLCANAPFRQEETWIVPLMQQAYLSLHQLGYAHSVEVWLDKELVGGLYGVAINGFFSGESMFYSKSNASKFALVALVQLLKSNGIKFIDCQIINKFLANMGAIEVDRNIFKGQLHESIQQTVNDDIWTARELIIEL
ncbi:leucyl/phenylalanyl-tRNA--protein transferase [Litorilituus lipolyticus]|uniref:Leucyl/phenylalanyl-tRNA--protein transferase n=1 Tax=Litorilituus lipolyticus TaxID=2491017 RepID=A0A502KN03_9GAMM|nr:leucyl/phenylalanyl-tRNA--protein transferase [Litorilituus lipolyticus]TPH12826.1 leucyl/phenylalanyl-tRNA--protein transferase [Litorilituus lipolyticus]